MKTTGKLLAGAATLGLLVSVAGVAKANDTAELFKKKCAICHGAEGKADTKAAEKKGIRSFLDPEVKADLNRDRMIKSLTDGIPSEDGNGFKKKGFGDKLSKEQIESLVDYVLELAK